MTNTITVRFPIADWVWLCEFLDKVIDEGDLDSYEKEDMEHLLHLLQAMTR